MSKKIKNNHVLVVGAGSSLKEHWDKIDKFIKENNIITVGCNNINHILTPDYHFWTDRRRYLKYGKNISKESTIVFGDHFRKKIIRKHWDGPYKIINYSKQKWKKSYEDPSSPKYGLAEARYNKKENRFYGVFRTVGSLIILWAHVKKASKISVVGMDGYTLYSLEELNNNAVSQHCYGKGYTDTIASHKSIKKNKDKKKFYDYCIEKDEHIYKTLRSIAKYGVKFEIITPTVYKDFYNGDILGI